MNMNNETKKVFEAEMKKAKSKMDKLYIEVIKKHVELRLQEKKDRALNDEDNLMCTIIELNAVGDMLYMIERIGGVTKRNWNFGKI